MCNASNCAATYSGGLGCVATHHLHAEATHTNKTRWLYDSFSVL